MIRDQRNLAARLDKNKRGKEGENLQASSSYSYTKDFHFNNVFFDAKRELEAEEIS